MRSATGYLKFGRDIMRHETVRKCLHMQIAFLPMIYRICEPLAYALLAGGIVVYSLSEYVRIQCSRDLACTRILFRWINTVTLFVSRERERDSFMIAPLTLAFGAGLTMLVFDERAFTIGIFALAFGDTAAALFGRLLPIHMLPYSDHKSWGGFLGCTAATAAAVFILTGSPGKALVLGLAAAVLEAIPFPDYDNLIIPLGTAFLAGMLL